MSDADPHAFYSFSLSVKAPFLFLLRNIHSKRVKLSILLSRIHFVCLTNDERASIFISYHGRSCHSNRKSKQGSKGPEQSQCKKSAAVSSISTSTSTSSFNKRHLYLWPIDQRDCLSWFHLILRAWRTLKDVQSGAAIPKLNVVEMLKKVLNTWDEANPARAQQTHQGSAPPRVGGTAHAGDAHAQADEDEEQAEQQEQPVSGSDGEESLCYFCRSSRGSTATDRHRDERALQPASSSQADKPFNLQQPLAQHPVANLLQVDGVHMSVTAASPAILAPPPTLTHCAVTSANASCAVSSLTPVVFHNDGSPVQGQQLTNAVPMSMPMPLQIELHCIEESGEDEKGNVCARSSRAVAVRVSRHRRGPSYSAHTFNSPPDPLSNPLTSPQFRPIQRSKSNLVPAEEMCQQMLELRARMQRLEFLLTRLKKDEGTLKARNAGNLAALGCRQKILKEQNILLRKIATQRMYQRLNQPSIYV